LKRRKKDEIIFIVGSCSQYKCRQIREEAKKPEIRRMDGKEKSCHD